MKLLVISHSAFLRVNQALYGELALPGAEVTVLAPSEWRADFASAKTKLQKSGGEKFSLLGGNVAFGGKINYFFFTSPLLLGMRRARPDIVLIDEEPWSFSALQAAAAARLFGAEPVFYTKENLPRRLRFPLPIVERTVFALCGNAFAISDESAELLGKRGFKGRVEKLYLGIDTALFRRRDAAALRKKLGLKGFVAGYMGRLIREKGVETLLDACAELDFEFTAVIDGFGDEGYRKELEERAAELGIRGRVVFVNPDYLEMPHYISALDALVLPSRTTPHWKEQFGRVLVEAMACGVPVIGSDSGSIPDVIGDAGIVFREGDAAELAGAISKMRNSKGISAAFAAKGRRRAAERFSWERIAQDANVLFGKIMRGREKNAAKN
ncbi:MAG: glycosyltransferase [Candidatus Diapherotrites archaeon]